MQKPTLVLAGVFLGVVIAALASAQNSSPTPPQSIMIEPIDATHVRLRLAGQENWVVESGAFTVRTDSDSVNLIAQRGNNRVILPTFKSESVAETFELQITPPAGRLGFSVAYSKRVPAQQ